jgi:hypothetical protein
VGLWRGGEKRGEREVEGGEGEEGEGEGEGEGGEVGALWVRVHILLLTAHG